MNCVSVIRIIFYLLYLANEPLKDTFIIAKSDARQRNAGEHILTRPHLTLNWHQRCQARLIYRTQIYSWHGYNITNACLSKYFCHQLVVLEILRKLIYGRHIKCFLNSQISNSTMLYRETKKKYEFQRQMALANA